MRIQHNIMAMNAYRNYNTNTKALSGNLEKLSSGYKINRAGDDAAGLAISEKMRAQITGLDAAQKNVKDGISLVKTAEGAMQEIQDMLNRMDYLATQSANGTYQNEVDRENLQKEVNNLKTEINRIADSANFNGIKLLDGSLDAGGTTSSTTVADLSNLGEDMNTRTVDATAGTYAMKGAFGTASKNGDTHNMSVTVEDASGNKQVIDVELKVSVTTDGTNTTIMLEGANGSYPAATASGATAASATEVANAMAAELRKISVIGDNFTVVDSASDGKLTFTAKEAGTDTYKITGIENSSTVAGTGVTTPVSNNIVTTAAVDAFVAADFSNAKIWDGQEKTLEDAIFEVNGEKFVFVDAAVAPTAGMSAATKELLAAAGVGNNYVKDAGTSGSIDATDVKNMVGIIATATGLSVEQGASSVGTDGTTTWTKGSTGTSDVEIAFKASTTTTSKAGGKGLTLQIGDTSDKFNQMTVIVGDMHTNAMGTGKTTLDGKEVNVTKTIADIDIGTQEGAQEAVAVIKNAINYVSSVRGDLGAIQNRLDHTANNLSVMAENIQDAESTIRDTDVANEMMSYVKNNILVQSAQAMLAQANQVPQGVLQLLG